ncbi:hypothetical protein [Streptomyces cyslabdanicus]|uniref:hypothetical protein n=1 Tax=Streptomyces cyslabdanicus TaxID=1470456 RepID=UPI0040442348
MFNLRARNTAADNAQPDGHGSDGKKLGRRRLLSRIGTTGLATSAAVFVGTAAATKASAQPLCCSLANYPENTTYSYCSAHAAYIWYCSANPYLHCACCETAGNKLSAAQCQYN